MASYVESRIVFRQKLSKDFVVKVEKEGLLDVVVPVPDKVYNTMVPLDKMDVYNKFVRNGYKIDPNDSEEDYQFFKVLQENKENYGFSDFLDYTEFTGTCSLYSQHFYDEYTLVFSSKWVPLSKNFLDTLAKTCPDFSYYFEGEEMWGGEIEYENGKEVYSTGWNSPEYRCVEVVINGIEIEIYELLSWDKDGYEMGYYSDDTFEQDHYLGKTLQNAINELNKHEF